MTVILSNSDAAMHGSGTQVNQQTIGLKDAVSFVEGMDHALMGYSSQHPREHHNIERLVRVFEPLGLPHLIVYALCKPLRQIPACLGDKLGIRVIRVHYCAKLSKAKGEPPVPATDFEYTFATPISDAIERSYFILFRINPERHISHLLFSVTECWLIRPSQNSPACRRLSQLSW